MKGLLCPLFCCFVAFPGNCFLWNNLWSDWDPKSHFSCCKYASLLPHLGSGGFLCCRAQIILTYVAQTPEWLISISLIACWGFFCVLCSEAKVVMDKAIMLDGATVSAAFDDSADMGIVGTVAGTLWYINWSDNSSIRLVSGHMTRVADSLRTFRDKGAILCCCCFSVSK